MFAVKYFVKSFIDITTFLYISEFSTQLSCCLIIVMFYLINSQNIYLCVHFNIMCYKTVWGLCKLKSNTSDIVLYLIRNV